MKRVIAPLIAGLLVAASMPPWGWWPLALLGLAWYGSIAISRREKSSFLTGFVFALGWFVLPLLWMRYLTLPGYVITCLIFATMHGLANYVANAITSDNKNYRNALIVCHALVEVLRMSWPFGGVPLATLAIGQVHSPLVLLAPTAGVIGITVATLWVALSHKKIRALLTITVIIVGTSFFNTVNNTGSLHITGIQGGGEQGTHAIYSSARKVFEKHLALTKTLQPNKTRDVIVWPENVVNVTNNGLFVDSVEYVELAAEAKRLNVPIVVSITEDSGNTGFTNAAIVLETDGTISGRYDKVRRVPFGEYMPLRRVLTALGAPTNLVPRDARAGDARAWLDVAGTRVAVAISWEVFFGGRVNEGVADGASFIINPTNGSSYTGTILQSQQVASSQLRAREQSRWLAQVSPTGFSEFVSPDGEVSQRSRISEEAVIDHTISLRSGRTIYSFLGNRPYIAALLVFLLLLLRRRPRTFPQAVS